MQAATRIGVISDTHGLLRPAAVDRLRGVDLIVHAGDLGRVSILEELQSIAPTIAVRGNVDHGDWAETLPLFEVVDVAGVLLYVIHIREDMDLDPVAAGMRVVVYGHTHEPAQEERDGVLFLNPGSIGPRRFDLPVTMAILSIESGVCSVETIELAVD